MPISSNSLETSTATVSMALAPFRLPVCPGQLWDDPISMPAPVPGGADGVLANVLAARGVVVDARYVAALPEPELVRLAGIVLVNRAAPAHHVGQLFDAVGRPDGIPEPWSLGGKSATRRDRIGRLGETVVAWRSVRLDIPGRGRREVDAVALVGRPLVDAAKSGKPANVSLRRFAEVAGALGVRRHVALALVLDEDPAAVRGLGLVERVAVCSSRDFVAHLVSSIGIGVLEPCRSERRLVAEPLATSPWHGERSARRAQRVLRERTRHPPTADTPQPPFGGEHLVDERFGLA